MKLEPVHKSQYNHDSLGENTFYFWLIKQMNQSTYFKLVDCLVRGIQVDNYRRPVLEYFIREM
jgi:hypothetical protein